MSNSDKEQESNKHTGARIAGVVTLFGAPIIVGCTNSAVVEQIPMPTNTKELNGETVTLVPNTPEATPTVPVPTATLTTYNYPTPTETPKPVEKSPLPSYGVFFGDVTNEKTGIKLAELVVASIPQKDGPEQIFYYFITTKDSAGTRRHASNQTKLGRVQGNKFQTVVFQNEIRGFDAEFIEKDKTIEGKFNELDPNSKLKLNQVGTGKNTILSYVQRIMNDLSSDQPKKTMVELQVDEFASKWP